LAVRTCQIDASRPFQYHRQQEHALDPSRVVGYVVQGAWRYLDGFGAGYLDPFIR
jgi:hypothetical protein